MRQRILIGALIAAAMAAGVVWFLENYEYVDDHVFVGYQGEARSNAFFAAQRFLQARGFRVESAGTLADLIHLPAHGVLVVGADRWALPPQIEAELLAWVRRGNTLILETKPSGLHDSLAAALSIDRTYVSHEGAPSVETDPSPPRSPQERNGNGPGEGAAHDPLASRPRPLRGELYTLPWVPARTLRIVLATWQSISLQTGGFEFALGDDRGAYVIGFALGEGRVVAFNNFLPWFNWGIGHADNALLIEHLAGRQGRVPIIFFRNPVKLSLWSWLVGHAGTALLAGAALLGLCLWRALVRSGPIMVDPPPAQRRWADHIEASGRFLWGSGARAKLVARAREAAFSRVQHRIPGFSALPAARRKEILLQRFGFTADEADQLLGSPQTNASGLLSEARLLRRLHRATDLYAGMKFT